MLVLILSNPIALPFGINAIINNAAIVDIPDITIGTNDPSLSNNLPPATLPIKHATPNIEPATPNFAGSNPFCPNTGIACVDTETTAKHINAHPAQKIQNIGFLSFSLSDKPSNFALAGFPFDFLDDVATTTSSDFGNLINNNASGTPIIIIAAPNAIYVPLHPRLANKLTVTGCKNTLPNDPPANAIPNAVPLPSPGNQ